MKPISEVLNEIRSNFNRRLVQQDDTRNGATVYVVIDDEKTEDEPVVHQSIMSEEYLARSNDEKAAREILERSLVGAFREWRGKR